MKKQDELRAQLARMKAEAEEKLKAGALEDAKAKVAEMDGILEGVQVLESILVGDNPDVGPEGRVEGDVHRLLDAVGVRELGRGRKSRVDGRENQVVPPDPRRAGDPADQGADDICVGVLQQLVCRVKEVAVLFDGVLDAGEGRAVRLGKRRALGHLGHAGLLGTGLVGAGAGECRDLLDCDEPIEGVGALSELPDLGLDVLRDGVAAIRAGGLV